MITDINSEDRLTQQIFADHLHDVHGWERIYAHNDEVFGRRLPPSPPGRGKQGEGVAGTGVCDLGRPIEREVIH